MFGWFRRKRQQVQRISSGGYVGLTRPQSPYTPPVADTTAADMITSPLYSFMPGNIWHPSDANSAALTCIVISNDPPSPPSCDNQQAPTFDSGSSGSSNSGD